MNQRSTFDDAVIRPSDSIRTAMARIDRNSVKICVILDDDGQLCRTVTDGDIRRVLLEGAFLDDPVSTLPAQNAVTFPEGAAPATLLDAMDRKGVNAIILINEVGLPVGLVDRGSLSKMILLSPPHMGGEEARHVQQAFEENWIAPVGPNLEAFERRLAEFSKRDHAVALSSGTAGLHLALRALNLPRKTRVYLSDLTFAGTIQPVFYEGLEPVLIDSEPGTWNMSVDALRRQIEADIVAGRRIGAVLVVHLYGQSANIAEILALTEAHGIPLIEDAAESLGAEYDNQPSGSHGLISVYSFNGNKIITTSSGGALITDSPQIAAQVRNLSTQGRDPFEHYQHGTVAYNYRMSNILAGVGLGQLDVLPSRVAARRIIFDRYRDGLADIPGLSFQQDSPRSRGNRWLTVIEFDPDIIAIHPYQIMRRLRQQGIESRPGWKPMHMQPLCLGYDFVPHSETEVVSSAHFQKALCLPTGSSMTETQQRRVISVLRSILMENLV